MTFADPLLLFRNRKISKEFATPIRARGHVENTTEYIGDFKSNDAERHVGKSGAFFREIFHVGV